jgi:hypothetical protein
MKTDERRLAWAFNESHVWALVHDAIAHPLMAVFYYARWTRRFHAWTSDKAWPPAQPVRRLPHPPARVEPVLRRWRRNG